MVYHRTNVFGLDILEHCGDLVCFGEFELDGDFLFVEHCFYFGKVAEELSVVRDVFSSKAHEVFPRQSFDIH